MAQEMGADTRLAGQLVVFSTLVSGLTIFIYSFLLRLIPVCKRTRCTNLPLRRSLSVKTSAKWLSTSFVRLLKTNSAFAHNQQNNFKFIFCFACNRVIELSGFCQAFLRLF